MRDATDEDLVALVVRRGTLAHRAYAWLVARHQGWVRRYLLHLLGDAGTADDVAQDVFLRAWLALPRLRERVTLRAWLRTIATRAAFNHIRGARRRGGYEERSPPIPERSSVETAVEAREAVLAVLDRLAYPYREVLVLRYVEELDVAEIAKHLDIGLSAAKMRLVRAREAFTTAYEAMTDGD